MPPPRMKICLIKDTNYYLIIGALLNFARLSNHMFHCPYKLLPRCQFFRAAIFYLLSLNTYHRIIDTARALSKIWRTDDHDEYPESCRCIHSRHRNFVDDRFGITAERWISFVCRTSVSNRSNESNQITNEQISFVLSSIWKLVRDSFLS